MQGKKLFVGKLGPTAKKMTSMVNNILTDVSVKISSELSIEKSAEKSEPPSLPAINGVPSFITKPVHIPDLMTALSSVSQMIAPKIKLKEKKPINKESIQLNFKF